MQIVWHEQLTNLHKFCKCRCSCALLFEFVRDLQDLIVFCMSFKLQIVSHQVGKERFIAIGQKTDIHIKSLLSANKRPFTNEKGSNWVKSL